MTTIGTDPQSPALTSYQGDVATYWNAEADPVNIRLGDVDGTYHHHYGIGEADWSCLDAAEPETAVINELHRLESAQASLLLDHLAFGGQPLREGHRVLDAGSGRGGSSFMANERYGVQVDGVSISAKQVGFANDQARRRGVDGKVRFHLADMLDTGLPAGEFNAIWNNESTMYVDLYDLFGAHSKLLKRGGRYVTITGCYNDVYGQVPSKAVSTINMHYECGVHSRRTYFAAMAANRLVPAAVVDLTAATIPYWELRSKSSVATGIEEAFLSSYREGSFQYLLIAADRV
ncbi:geranyl diphosphate 2-C-methyltransferase [Actinomadura parmotrematis]|uniref:Methyltransferase domain-containing protein n=1 Tax=Actinomadura parmotrematis TaxID=2864039 RepID=A0ABS7G221_9ACTN|nr:geranyl diphosphate 2-C-methyltransferase [Actinomadura parmotrematis]MBW8486722.1 methyltransferase domain-containing protein [Actinomadura parmotrematis]